MKRNVWLAGLATCALVWCGAALAQAYPNKPVKLVVPFPPGGSTNIIGRAVAQKLSDEWGVQVVVENKPGAGGSLGADFVAKAAPDGYTLLLGHVGTLAVNPLLYPKLPYDPATHFAPISLVAEVPVVLVTNPSFAPKTVAEIVAYAKANPGKVNYGSAGNGSANHLAMEYFQLLTKTDLVHVPYKGTAPAILDLMSGQVSMTMVGAATVLGNIQAGKIRAVAVSSPKRLDVLPQTPTIVESGLSGFEASPWFGVLAPAGTPKEIVTKIHTDLLKAMKSDDMRKSLSTEGAVIVTNTPDQFSAYIKSEIARWAKVVKDSGMKIE
jgi:tripartite-type tricarboxylate transporter receptor subunit TctC